MRSKESSEMYLEVIYELEERNKIVRSVDVAKKLNYTKPSVTRAMGILKKNGYITQPPYGDITLTVKGRKKAKQIHNRHHLITDFLIATLGIDFEEAQEDACRIEHIISEKSIDAMQKYMNEGK